MSRVTRRAFLRSIGGMATGAAVLSCDSSEEGGGTGDRVGAEITRPLLRHWSDESVWMDDPIRELPVAYVSMARRQVFVDYDFRDRASWLLDAHISVSTAHWRIPLPGDRVSVPITPGDSAREFEELDMREWDPAMAPAMDDIRVVRGNSVIRRVDFACVPLTGVRVVGSEAGAAGDRFLETWCSAGPWSFEASDGDPRDTMREDFSIVGLGTRFADRTCEGPGDTVQLVSWARVKR